MGGSSLRRVFGAGCSAAVLMSAACAVSSFVPAHAAAAVPPPRTVPSGLDRDATDQIIVRLRDGSAPDTATLSRLAGQSVRLGRSLAHGSWVTRLPGRRSLAAVTALANRIAALPGVASAEPDRRMYPMSVPNDPYWSAQWDLFAPTASTFGANLPGAWDVTHGTSDVVVAVIDTGITNHIDLVGQTVPGYDFIADTTVSNDGNGRDADPSDPGDWISTADAATATYSGCPVANSSWHGTHVSGTIAALTNNNLGVAGIASGVKILPVRVLGKCGGYESDIVDGMRWAAGLAVAGVPTNPNPASVLNFSLGGTGLCSAAEQSAVNDVLAVGATVVIAAGNSNADASGFSPGNCNGVITVAATGATGNRAYYSNYGTSVEITAPGGDSTVSPGGVLSTLNAGATVPTTDTYASYQGTSMATPHVAGVAALVKSVDPSISPAAMTALLQSTVTPFPVVSTCTTSNCGAGELNAAAAVAAGVSAYGPRVLGAFSKTSPAPGAIAQTRSGTLQWSASTGATSYSVCLVAGLTAPCTSWTSVGNVTSMAYSGLSANSLYAWQVRATNGTNTAEANVSLRSTFTTAATTAPGVPTSVTGTRGNNSVSLTWAAPTDDGGSAITDYVVQFSSNGGGSWSTFADGVSTTTAANVTGLTNGTAYAFHVAAKNAVGTGSYSVASAAITPATTPGVPTSVAGTPGNGSVSLTWTAPSNTGGSAITDYTVQYGASNTGPWTPVSHAPSTAVALTVTGLSNATTYFFQVAAVNGVGAGNYSTSSSAVTTNAALAGAPTAVAGVRGASSVSLTWTAPLDNGGSAITDYVVRYSSNGGGTWSSTIDTSSTATYFTVPVLTNGVAYVFEVAAANGVGTGTYSSPSAAVTPATIPVNPTAPTGTAGVQQVSLSWSAPADGGSAISDYLVRYSANGGGTWSSTIDTSSTATHFTVPGLTQGVSYVFDVAAVNDVGAGGWSVDSSPVRVVTTPGAPTTVLGVPSNGAVALSWTAPADNGGSAIADYVVEYSSTGGSSWSAFAHTPSAAVGRTVTGLTNGVPYVFRLTAVNVIGPSDVHDLSLPIMPRTVPAALAAPSAMAGNGRVSLSWIAPADGGAPILDYVVQWSTNGVDWTMFVDGTSTNTGAVVTGLANAVGYRFRVEAVNVAGVSSPGAPSPVVVPRSAPAKPGAPKAKAANASVTLSWVTPGNGGAPITDYAIQSSSDNGITWKRLADGVNTATSFRVTLLTNGHRYLFRIAAINVAGTSAYSLAVAATPATPPAAVARPTVTSASGRVSVHWAAPATGGAPITDYTVQYSSNNGLTWTTYADGVRATTGATLLGLRRGVTYRYRVAAVNVMGRGAFSVASVANRLV
jgi:serine protease